MKCANTLKSFIFLGLNVLWFKFLSKWAGITLKFGYQKCTYIYYLKPIHVVDMENND